MTKKKYTVAEFFCGCGGTSRGFSRSGRFNVVLGNDVKAEALRTFEHNHRSDELPPAVVRRDVRALTTSSIRDILSERAVGPQELDVMIGGPPCQGFSQLRRNEHREKGKIVKFSGYSQLAHDPRNDLVLRYLEIAEALRPKFVVIENVPQMLNHGFDGRLGKLSELVIQMLEKDLGYNVDVAIVNSADYGVPQLRERAIFIASSMGGLGMPPPTHSSPEDDRPRTSRLKPWVTVEQAIGDLPPPPIGQDVLGGKSVSLYEPKFSDYAVSMQSSTAFPYNHVTRNYKQQVLDIINKMKPGKTWDAESARITTGYERLISRVANAQGISRDKARANLERQGKINSVFYRKYYWSAYTRLSESAPALTITANANFLGSGRFTHPKEARGITIREAARLQSFDDDFRFVTSMGELTDTPRIGIGMDMVGEAVPPELAKAIAMHLAKRLDGHADNGAKG